MSKRTKKELVSALREKRRTAAFWRLTFANLDMDGDCSITTKQANAIEEVIKKGFELWWDSWVEPLIDEVEQKLCPAPKPKKSEGGTDA